MVGDTGMITKEDILALIKEDKYLQAFNYLRILLDCESKQTNYRLGQKIFQQLGSKRQSDFQFVKLGILSTSMLEPIVPYIQTLGYINRLNINVYLGGFNQVNQEVMNSNSGLYLSAPDVIFLSLRSEYYFKDLCNNFPKLIREKAIQNSIETGLKQVDDLIKAIRQNSDTMIILQNFSPPAYPHLGMMDVFSGQISAFHEINSTLSQKISTWKNVFLLDYANLIMRCGWDQWYDPRMWCLARQPLSAKALPLLANACFSFIQAKMGRNRKCLVLDLDNTLWGGILGEDGVEGIQIGHDFPGNAYLEFQKAVFRLYERGIILAICSKNNEVDAIKAIESHPDMVLSKENFATWRINWNDKASNLSLIAQDLNIGLDSIVFIDDNPAERELIRTFLPEVLVPEMPKDPVEYRRVLEKISDFDALTWSPEDRVRTQFYREESIRKQAKENSNSLEEFYRNLAMEVVISEADDISIARIAQLTQRTNQFTLTTKRYTEFEIKQLAKDQQVKVYFLRLKDRYGDSGIVGVAIIKIKFKQWEIDSFLLSCRVLGRTVESAFLAYITDQAKSANAMTLEGIYIRSEKNEQTLNFYLDHGITKTDENDSRSYWNMPLLNKSLAIPAWIKVNY